MNKLKTLLQSFTKSISLKLVLINYIFILFFYSISYFDFSMIDTTDNNKYLTNTAIEGLTYILLIANFFSIICFVEIKPFHEYSIGFILHIIALCALFSVFEYMIINKIFLLLRKYSIVRSLSKFTFIILNLYYFFLVIAFLYLSSNYLFHNYYNFHI